jgi:hypothetical protein
MKAITNNKYYSITAIGYLLVTIQRVAQHLENGFQYLPPISVEFSSQKVGVRNNINMIVGRYWKI